MDAFAIPGQERMNVNWMESNQYFVYNREIRNSMSR